MPATKFHIQQVKQLIEEGDAVKYVSRLSSRREKGRLLIDGVVAAKYPSIFAVNQSGDNKLPVETFSYSEVLVSPEKICISEKDHMVQGLMYVVNSAI